MRLARLCLVLPVCCSAWLLTACFATTMPVLEAGDPLPGGAGVFRLLDEAGEPRGRLVLSAIKGAGNKYRARSEAIADGRPKIDEGELILKRLSGDRYLAQFRESEGKYLLSPAVVTNAKFTIMVIDADTLSKIAADRGVRAMQEPVDGDRREIGRAIEAGEAILVLSLDGPSLYAPAATALDVALAMAKSDEAVPLEDGDYVRQTK